MKKNVTVQQDETMMPNVAETAQLEAHEDATLKVNEDSEAIECGDGKKLKAQRIAKYSVSYLAKISMLTAIGVVLMILDFPILPAVPYLELNFSDFPTLIASFMLGPVTGVLVNAAKIGVNLLITGTKTNMVGPLSNLISGTLYALTAGIIYKLKKDKIGAIIALIVSSIVFCIAMWFTNQFILLPAYGIKDHDAQMVNLWWTLLFNVIKTTLTCIITMLIYKSARKLFNKF